MASLGIIGGADGPTAVFVSGSPGLLAAVLLAVIALAGVGIYLFRHRRGH